MAAIRSDRRLCVTVDYSELVEETDPRAAFLLVQAGGWITEGDVVRYGVTTDANDRVVIDGASQMEAKMAARPEDKMRAAPENKAVHVFEADEAGANADDADEWTLKSTPAEYLERYPDGPHADLARQILVAESDSGEP